MDVSLDELIAGQKKTGGARRRPAAAAAAPAEGKSSAASVKKDSIKPASKKAVGQKRKGQTSPAPARKNGKGTPLPKIAAPILVSRRLLDADLAAAGGGRGGRRANNNILSHRSAPRSGGAREAAARVVVVDSSTSQRSGRAPVRVHELTEQERLKATNIKIITELDGIPTPVGALRKFVEEAGTARSSRRLHGPAASAAVPTRLADRFR